MSERSVRPSAKALILHEGRLLAIRIDDHGDVFYIMPGGGQQAGELLPEAVAREVAEETGLRVSVGDLAFVIEGAQGERSHRVDLVFHCHLLCDAPDAAPHTDTNQTGYAWLDVATLNRAPLYPSRLRRPIMALAAGLPGPVYLGNENMGDPEITD